MAITNFILTVAGVAAVALFMSKDLKQSSAMVRRNMRHVRTWLEEQGTAAEQAAKHDVKQVQEGKPPSSEVGGSSSSGKPPEAHKEP